MNILHLAFQTGISKKLPRTGWVEHKIKSPETVAEHCFRVIVLAMALAPHLELDQHKLIKMAIIHDLGETATGDLVVQRGKTLYKDARKEKEKIEEESIRAILRPFGEEHQRLFHEMIQRKTKESLIFWEIDKLEMAVQAYEYEKEQKINLSEFFDSAGTIIKHPLLKKAFDDLKKMRTA